MYISGICVQESASASVTYIRIHTYIHTHTHTHMHVPNTHTHTHTHILIYTHTRTHTHQQEPRKRSTWQERNEWVMSHTHQRDMSHIYPNHVTYTYVLIISPRPDFIGIFCAGGWIWDWVKSGQYGALDFELHIRAVSHTWTSHVTHMNKSSTHRMSHATHIGLPHEQVFHTPVIPQSLVCRQTGVWTNWCVDQLVCRPTGVSTNWCVDQLVCRMIGVSTNWCVEWLVCRPTGVSTN